MPASKSPKPDAASASSPAPNTPAKSPDNAVTPSTPDDATKPSKPGRVARPNTEAFKADLAAKENEHEEVMKKFVSGGRYAPASSFLTSTRPVTIISAGRQIYVPDVSLSNTVVFSPLTLITYPCRKM